MDKIQTLRQIEKVRKVFSECPVDHTNPEQGQVAPLPVEEHGDARCVECGVLLVYNNNADPTPMEEAP